MSCCYYGKLQAKHVILILKIPLRNFYADFISRCIKFIQETIKSRLFDPDNPKIYQTFKKRRYIRCLPHRKCLKSVLKSIQTLIEIIMMLFWRMIPICQSNRFCQETETHPIFVLDLTNFQLRTLFLYFPLIVFIAFSIRNGILIF